MESKREIHIHICIHKITYSRFLNTFHTFIYEFNKEKRNERTNEEKEEENETKMRENVITNRNSKKI